jgi:hypothetical protein
MAVPASEYTGATIAAMTIVPLLIAILAGVAVGLFRKAIHPDTGPDDDSFFLWCAIASAAGVVVAAVGLWWGMYPWKAEYHEWRPVSGVVETIDSRLVASGNGDGSMEDKFVVTFKGNPQEYGVLDTRAAAVKPGDTLTITCVRRWQWSGSHGYDCNFVDMERDE